MNSYGPDNYHFLIVEDHEAVVAGIVPDIQARYPQAEISTVKDVQSAKAIIAEQTLSLIVIDLILPAYPQSAASAQAGTALLKQLMNSSLAPNLMVLSINIRPLIRLKSAINAYGGGFVALDKATPLQNIVNKIDIALRGSIYLPPAVRSRPEFDRRWLEVLTLKYEEGLSDKAIAEVMGISDRTVRNYWARIQDALNVYTDSRKDLRIQIQQAAKKAGLIT